MYMFSQQNSKCPNHRIYKFRNDRHSERHFNTQQKPTGNDFEYFFKP